MKTRILLSAIIGAVLAGVFYPAPELTTRIVALAAAFFVLIGILTCTMWNWPPDRNKKPQVSDPSRSPKDKSIGNP